MTCPDWPNLASRRDQEGADDLLWERALTHLDGCERCCEAAYSTEPTLVFRRLPAPATTEDDIAAMQQAVAAMRRVEPLVEPAARRAWPAVALRRAAAVIAVPLAALLLYGVLGEAGPRPSPPPVPAEGLPHALLDAATSDVHFDVVVLRATKGGAAGTSLGQLDVPRPIRAELDAKLDFDRYEVLARADVTSKIGDRQVTSAMGKGFGVSFESVALVENGLLQLAGFQIEKTSAVKGPQSGPQPVLNANLNLALNKPVTLLVSSHDSLVVAIYARR